MSDETSQAIFGDAVAASLEKPGRKRRGLFRRKKPAEERPPFTHCEDCGAELHGRYCSNCGQVAVDYHRSFRHVVADVAESFLNWDSKFTKTLLLLVIYPGWLTNQFVAGRRTRYLHPLRLYLLVSIVFFLGVRFAPIQTRPVVAADMTPKDSRRGGGGDEESGDSRPRARRSAEKAWPNGQRRRPRRKLARPGPPSFHRRRPRRLFRGDSSEAIGRWIFPELAKRKVKEDRSPRKQRPTLIKTLRDNISTMMLFCIPLFALVLKILYLRQRRFYIEHLVYALHIHSFFYIAVLLTVFSAMAASRWAPALEGPLVWLCVLAIVAQVFLSIRQVYRQRWFMTTFKFFFGGFIYLFVLILALAVTAAATLLLS